MEVGGLSEVMSWVLGFGRQAEVLEPEHLRAAVAEEVHAVAGRYREIVETEERTKQRQGETDRRQKKTISRRKTQTGTG